MSSLAQRFHEDCDHAFERVESYCCMSIGIELQQAAIAELEVLQGKSAAAKQSAVQQQDEDGANKVLACECLLAALISDLRLWCCLKQDDAEGAWAALVEAQEASCAAMRAHKCAAHLGSYIGRLADLERLLFPPQVFASAGWVVTVRVCSVCGQNYEDCDHFVGKPYAGEFCCVRIEAPSLEEVSIVSNPASKHHRITSVTDPEGRYVNRLTMRLVEDGDRQGS